MLRRLAACKPSFCLTDLSRLSSVLLCICSGLILALPFINADLWIASWIGFLPLLVVVRNCRPLHGFFYGFLCGFVFWLATVYWLIHVTMAGMLVLVVYLAVYFGIFGFFVSWQKPASRAAGLFLIPAAWVALEYIRSYLLTGFGWALLGYGQWQNLSLIQIADVTGVWGISFAVMMVNVGLLRVFFDPCGAGCCPARRILPVLLVLMLMLSYGRARLAVAPDGSSRSFSIAVIQGNIPQEVKWQAYSREQIIEKYLALSQNAAGCDLMIWPEAALPVVLEQGPLYFAQVRRFARSNNLRLLFGAVTERDAALYNSAVYLDGISGSMQRYDKIHLVPFGEYIPLPRLLGFLGSFAPIGEMTAGREYKVFDLEDRRFSVLICFEDLFPELARRLVGAGADFLVTITNDAWYKISPAAYQHFQASVFRAVENRVPVIRAANTGVSGFIAATGEVIRMLGDGTGRHLFVDSSAVVDIGVPVHKTTLYQRYPDAFAGLCAVICIAAISVRIIKRAKAR